MLSIMSIKLFCNAFLRGLVGDSLLSTRKRQNYNLHEDYSDPCQRLFNAIHIDSYIPPHRHSLDPKSECLIAVRGLFALLIFDVEGRILSVTQFGSEVYCGSDDDCGVGVDIPPNVWHTVLALSTSAILFEVKRGPFNPLSSKELAPWAPLEDSPHALEYLQVLKNEANLWRTK
jgi:cupin fold WbuC family metalloprotein